MNKHCYNCKYHELGFWEKPCIDCEIGTPDEKWEPRNDTKISTPNRRMMK